MSLTKQILHERRLVVLFQLGVLLFILVGLFSAALIKPNQTANVQDTVDIKSVPVEEKDESSAPESISQTTVRAKAAYVWDVKNQRALYIKNADTVLPLASITKLMTSMLAYELASTDMRATVSVRAVGQEGSTGLVPGESLTMKELNSLALISSSNDAAFALGANAGSLLGDQDPSRQFVEGMNIRAEELNLDTLNFKNTTGLDLSVTEPGAIGSARDVSFLMEYILKNYPEVLEPTKLSAARIYNQNGEFHDIENTNEAIYAIPNLLGSKTGYTDLAGGNLTIAFDAGMNRPIIVTVLGSTRDERFSDVLALVKAVRTNISDI
jgi:serine-type D-Ala-D-Ala carboxypeptidase (penicillin-binding protein 5/6)